MTKPRFALGLFSSLLSLASCKADDPPSSAGPTDAGAEGVASTLDGSSTGASEEGVECTHKGAGRPIGGGRCECTTTRAVAGEWTTMRTCREGDVCPTKNKEEAVVFTQEGTTVHADRGDAYSLEGKLCGDVLVWSGGPKDGLNPECGVIRFSDDSHFMTDSCYVASGACAQASDQGCPSSKGQCTGTGSKKPADPTPIQKVICTQ